MVTDTANDIPLFARRRDLLMFVVEGIGDMVEKYYAPPPHPAGGIAEHTRHPGDVHRQERVLAARCQPGREDAEDHRVGPQLGC